MGNEEGHPGIESFGKFLEKRPVEIHSTIPLSPDLLAVGFHPIILMPCLWGAGSISCAKSQN